MASPILAADAHSDIVVDILRKRQAGETGVFETHHAKAMHDWGVAFMMLATGGDGPTQNIDSDNPFHCTLLRINALLADFGETPGAAAMCTAMREVDAARAAGRFAGMMMIEGAAPLLGSLECLEIVHRLGIRSIQLTWNARNEAGDGCAEAMTGSGLTRFGVRLVRAMEERRMLVDLSHASQSLFYSVCDHATRPFIVSHANARAVHDHPRNLADAQLKALAERDGIVGICFFPAFVDAASPTVDRLVDHLDHIAGIVGIDRVCIGADFIYYAREVFARELTASDRDGIYADGFDLPDELATPAGFALLREAMAARGYGEADIRKVFSENLMDMYRRTIG